MSDFTGVPATETVRKVRDGEVSASEVLEATLEAIDRLNPTLNAFVHIGADDARRVASETDERIRGGGDPGALAGVPTAMKDLFNMYPGWPSTFGGIAPLRGFIADTTSIYPARLEAAGATVVGATNSPVLGFRGTTDNPVFGPTCNPFDVTRNSGGSSGGSAAAVAAGLLPVADGTDGGGSIRIPSAWCGVYGFQPSVGRVPIVMRPNAFGGSAPYIYEGPIARTVADAALALGALAGYSPLDPLSQTDTVEWSEALNGSIKGKRIGYTRDFGVFAVDPRIAEGVERALAGFEEQGAIIVPLDVTLPTDQAELSVLWRRMISTGNLSVIAAFESFGFPMRDNVPRQVLEWADAAGALSPMEAIADQITRSGVFDAVEGAFADVDFIASPTVGALAVPNRSDGDTVGPSEIDGVAVDPLIGWCLTYITNFTGHPAASLPAGLIDGLPFGMQLIGRRRADASVLTASARFEEARPWIQTYGHLDPALRS